MWGSRPPHHMRMVYVYTVSLPCPALHAYSRRICWIHLARESWPRAVRSRLLFVHYWPLALAGKASSVFALPAAELSLQHGPWMFPGVVHLSAALLLRASCAAMMRSLSHLPVQPFPGHSHPLHAGACPLLMLVAILPHLKKKHGIEQGWAII